MNTIRMTLEPSDDGSLHLPLPPGLRQGRIRVEASLELVDARVRQGAKAGLWKQLAAPFQIADDFDEPLEDFKDYME